MEIVPSNNDLSIEVLSRLPAKSLLRFESVSREWHHNITDNLFRRLQSQQAKLITSGFYIQEMFPHKHYPTKYFSFTSENIPERPEAFDFLGGSVDLVASCNDLLLCCDIPNNVIYVCNPAKKEHVQMKWPYFIDQALYFGLAFDPVDDTTENSSNFKIVSFHREDDGKLVFQNYLSRTKEWRNLDVCDSEYDCGDVVKSQMVIFASGVLYWLAFDAGIVAFDVAMEHLHFISPPIRISRTESRILGESKGELHYVLTSDEYIRIWSLDRATKLWIFRHFIRFTVLEKECPCFLFEEAKRYAGPDANRSTWLQTVAYKDRIFLLQFCFGKTVKIFIYEPATKKMEFCVLELNRIYLGLFRTLPYSMSLAPL